MQKFVHKKSLHAFTLIEVLMTISLVGILTGVSIGLYDSALDEARFDATYKEMLQLRKAILGDLENTTIEGERVRFGYLGDVGGIPTTSQGLQAVYAQPTGVAGWAINSASKLGVGWNGPYIISSTDTDFTTDAWGNPYIYIASTTVPYILSYGADGVVGGTEDSQDIQIDLPLSLRTATVTGQITQSGSVFEGTADVTLYYAGSNAAVSSYAATLTSAGLGQFTFSSVPFGVRTVKVEIPNSAAPVMTLGPVTFAVDNQNYVLPSNLLEVNPLMSDANCNNIANVSYIDDSMQVDASDNTKVNFQIRIRNSFATRTAYTTNRDVDDGVASKLEQMGIGGTVYGCSGIIDIVAYGGLDRKFNACATTTSPFIPCGIISGGCSQGYKLLNGSPNISFNSTWGLPATNVINAYMKFTDPVTNLVNVTDGYIDLRLGCDLLHIVP